MSDQVLLSDMLNAVNENGRTISKLEELKTEVQTLKTRLQAKDDEFELLKTRLRMYEA